MASLVRALGISELFRPPAMKSIKCEFPLLPEKSLKIAAAKSNLFRCALYHLQILCLVYHKQFLLHFEYLKSISYPNWVKFGQLEIAALQMQAAIQMQQHAN